MAYTGETRALGKSLGGMLGTLVLIGLVATAALVIAMLPEHARKEVLYVAQDYLPIVMFLTLAVLLFSGYPVAFVLGGVALTFGLIGYFLGTFRLIEFFNFVPRIWGQAAENLVLVSIPTFIFMGVVMERSGIANDLLYCVQVLLKRVPGALALGVTIMGTILAAMTGIIGASVTMMTALALPTMMRQGYSHALACGTIAAAGTLGILIPPSIMLIIMADLLGVSVGHLFSAALAPGLTLAALYLLFIFTVASIWPRLAPPLPPELLAVPKGQMMPLLWRAFFPPVFLIGMIKCSILLGWATPSEAGAVGAFGALLLAMFAGKLNYKMMEESCHTSARTIAMVFFIIISATCFAYVYRALGGDDIVEKLIRAAGPHQLGPADPDHGDRVLPRLLPRLDRDHVDRAAGVRAADRRPRLRRSPAQGRRRALVRHPDGGQPADIVPDTTVWICAVLSQGHRAEGGEDREHLSRHHPVRDPAAVGTDRRHDLAPGRALAHAQRVRCIRSAPCSKKASARPMRRTSSRPC